MASCFYHPSAKGSTTCPTCNQHICDRCRINGNPQRCGTCQSAFSKGDGGGKRVMCENHASTPCDTKCKSCRKPHCQACLNSAELCFRCGMGTAKGPTGGLKARGGTGKLTAPPPPKGLAAIPKPLLAGGAAAVAVVALLGYGVVSYGHGPAPEKAFTGKSGIAITSPSGTRPLSGVQLIKLDVKSKEAVERIELTVDGKYWDRWEQGKQKPPYQSEWPTGIVPNGPHELVATVYYRGGQRMATDKRKFTTKNRQF